MDMSVKLSQVYPSVLPQAPVADRDPVVPAKVQELLPPIASRTRAKTWRRRLARFVISSSRASVSWTFPLMIPRGRLWSR